MAILNLNKPIITSRGILGDLRRQIQMDTGEEYLGSITALFQSNQEIETYPWLSQSPVMREWVGGRNPVALTEDSLEIKSTLYEASMIIPYSSWVKRDKTGQIQLRISQLAEKTTSHWAKLVSTQILNGASTTCYDGQYFYSTSHSEGSSGTQSNLTTSAAATGTQPTSGEFADALLTATQAIIGFKDDKGEPMQPGLRSFTVMVPVIFMAPAAAALGATNIIYTAGAGAATNPVSAVVSYGGFIYKLVVNPRLTWTDRFVLFANNPLLPSIVRQEENGIEYSAIAEGSEMEVMNDQWFFGVSSIRGVKLAMWQSSCMHYFT